MQSSENHASDLTQRAKSEILKRTLQALDSKYYKPELLGSDWFKAVDEHRAAIEAAPSSDLFEKAVSSLLGELKSSHLGFFHSKGRRASSRAALSAAYLAEETSQGSRWVFQDVHAGGAAAIAGIEPGNVLIQVNRKEIRPQEHPVFPMNTASEIVVDANDGCERTLQIQVARSKGKKLQYVEPTLVESRRLDWRTGYLKVAMFPGVLGVDVANSVTEAVNRLNGIERLIIDLRGNTGGGAGVLRLMSLLTPDRIPVGFAADRKWAERDLEVAKFSFPRLNRIPTAKVALWVLALRFLPTIISNSPVVMETEGLGPKTYHGHVALLIDRHTASAAEMVTVFAKENRLAKLIGEPTAGRLLSATSVKVGHGYRLALPTGAYRTWNGTNVEGSPIQPDVRADFDWLEARTGSDTALEAALQNLV